MDGANGVAFRGWLAIAFRNSFPEDILMLHRKFSCTRFSALAVALLLTVVTVSAHAQEPSAANDYGKKLPSPPAKASVSLDGKEVTINYSAPSLRERHVGAELAPYGKVWRTGANAATTLTTPIGLKIGDLSVPAGSYTLYSLPSETTWKLIVNKQTKQWGTVYNEDQDLGRIDMMKGPSPSAPVEKFVIQFEKTSGKTTQLHLIWEKTDVYVPVTAE